MLIKFQALFEDFRILIKLIEALLFVKEEDKFH